MFKGIYSEFKSIKLMKTKLLLFRQKQEVSTIYLFRPSMTPTCSLGFRDTVYKDGKEQRTRH